MIAPELTDQQETARQKAAERVEDAFQERRAYLRLRGAHAGRSSVLRPRDFANEARRVRRAARSLGIGEDIVLGSTMPGPDLISHQPDPNRKAVRFNGIRVVGSANQPYVRTTVKRMSKRARRRAGL